MQVEFFIQAVPSPSDAEIDLGEAARLGDAEAVAAALAAPLPDGTRLNVDATCDINGATALIIAAQQGHEDVVEVLLRAGANPNERSLHNPLLFNDGGGTPLTAAAFSGHTAVVQRLIEAGADVNARRVGDSVTPMHLAALNWQLATVRALLAAGADVAARSCYQGTPLYLAAQGQTDPEFQRPGASDQQVAVLQALIAAGSEVDARDQGGLAPLHAAARTGHAGAVTALLRAGADVEALSDPAAPPALHRPALYWAAAALHWAAARGHVECVRALLAGGANPAATAGAGLTAADHVRQAGSITPQGTTMLQLLAEAELRRRQARRACAVCGQAARSTCSRCRAVRYCSAGCQRRHWQVRLFEGWELWSMLLRSLPAASDRPLLLPGPQMHKRMCKAPGT